MASLQLPPLASISNTCCANDTGRLVRFPSARCALPKMDFGVPLAEWLNWVWLEVGWLGLVWSVVAGMDIVAGGRTLSTIKSIT